MSIHWKLSNILPPDASSIIYLAAALLIAWTLPHNEGPAEILTELCCWTWLFAWFEALPWTGVPWNIMRTAPANDSKLHLGLIAVGITFAALGRSLDDCRWIQPALIPALAIYRRSPWLAVIAQTLIAFVSILCLRPAFSNTVAILIVVGAASICSFALLALYTSLMRAFQKLDGYDALERNVKTINRPIRVIALGVIPILIAIYWAWIQNDNSPHTLVNSLWRGALKAAAWVFLLQATQSLPWDVAACIGAFSAASFTQRDVTGNSFDFVLKHLVASTAALAQTIFQLPPSRSKHFLWLFIVCPLLVVPKDPDSSLSNIIPDRWRITDGDRGSGPLPGLPAYYGQHPVEGLVQQSKDRFQSMLKNQSQTYEDAVAEYRRRYNIDPPPGFDKWFEFAKQKNSLIIDDFDVVFDFVAPLLRIPPATVRRFMDEAMGPPHISRCGFRGGKLVGDCGPRGMTVQNMTAPYQHEIPDLDILLSSHDEPTVLLAGERDDVMWDDHSNTRVRKYINQPCGSDWLRAKPRQHPTSPKLSSALPFIENILDSKDVCAHPEYADIHGYYISPPSFQIATKPVPILSQAKLSTFSDMLMPSQIYLRGYNNLNDYGFVDEDDPEWEQKESKLYWIGSNTGGGDFDRSWRDMHRQRFVDMAEDHGDPDRAAIYLNETSSGVWTPWKNRNFLPAWADVHFHAIRLCVWTECKAQMKYFHMSDRQSEKEQYRYKFLMDLDGNSYSGRFYSHLRSRSVSLKMTIFQEWHDDRLFPWVHYVPVSVSMDELPELIRFLVTTKRGQEIGKEIANLGREWWGKLLRVEDFQVYFYRLLLELARIVDEKRVIS